MDSIVFAPLGLSAMTSTERLWKVKRRLSATNLNIVAIHDDGYDVHHAEHWHGRARRGADPGQPQGPVS